MGELLLSELIEQTQAAVRSFEYSRSTVYQYQMAWRGLTVYFNENQQVIFSKSLTQRYVLELKAKMDAGTIKPWRYTFFRLVVRQLIEVSEQGHLTWICQKKKRSSPSCTNRLTFFCKRRISITSRKKGKAPIPSNIMKAFQENF